MNTKIYNKGFCNTCGKLVPANREQRDNLIYLVKDCPDCGKTETLISTDAERYSRKRELDTRKDSIACELNCVQCNHNKPNIVFLDITNRCNLNCYICINNTPSMGFLFDPPIEYFDKIFEHFSKFDPKPSIQLFGGEPTVRKDLFDIIKLGRSYGLTLRVTTNGIKLADEDYCRKLVDTHSTLLVAYDGDNREVYTHYRGDGDMLDKKVQALDNIEKIGKAKVVIMSLVARGYNDKSLPELFQFCHDRRKTIRGLYLMPLAETSEDMKGQFKERITTEDIEKIMDESFPEDSINFMPAGFLGEMSTMMKYLKMKPVPFTGAHPNCESLYLLVSDGEKYVPIERYLKGTLDDMCRDLLQVEKNMKKKVDNYDRTILGRIFRSEKMKNRILYMKAFKAMIGVIWRNFDLGKTLKGNGPGKIGHFLGLLFGILTGKKSRIIFDRHLRFQKVMQIIILPFEDDRNLETERLSRCPAAFAFWNPDNDKVQYVPVCAWNHFKDKIMKNIVKHYEQEPAETTSAPH